MTILQKRDNIDSDSDFYYYALLTTLIALTVLQKLHHLKKEKKYNKYITKIKCAQ